MMITPRKRDDGEPLVHIGAPEEPDGKPVVVVSPATEGTMTWISSSGDDLNPTPPATGRGDGPAIHLSFTEPDTKSVTFQYMEPVELHDGQVWYNPEDNWNNTDHFSVSVTVPANTPVENTGGTGNVNLVEVSPGSGAMNMYVIVPAAGDGTHDLDLDSAIPCFLPGNTGGYFEVNRFTGGVSLASDERVGLTKWGLFTFAIKSYFVKRVLMGHPIGVFDIDVYKAEWCHQTWVFEFSCTRNSTGSGEVAGWLMVFRGGSV